MNEPERSWKALVGSERPPGSPQIDADVVERLRGTTFATPNEAWRFKGLIADAADEIERLRAAILEACVIMGEDMDGTLPTWPPAHEWLVRCAEEWRAYREALIDEMGGI